MSSQNRHSLPTFLVPATVLSLVVSGCGFLDGELPTSGTPSPVTTTSIGSSSSPSTPTPLPSPTRGVSAPEIDRPQSGSEVIERRPYLVVENATTEDDVELTYSFEVASDAEFTDVVAFTHGQAEGVEGRTSWQVSEQLGYSKYYWRSRARAGLVKSPYSSIADFTVKQTTEPPPQEGEVLSDPLTSGTSVGEVHGGQFVAQGWKVTSNTDFIRYEIPSLPKGYVEWDNQGLKPMNESPDHFMLFGMWDPTRGDYRTNPYRVHIQKLDTNHNPPYVRLRWISGGEQHDEGYDFRDWNPSQTYRWRIEWGPEGSHYVVQVSLDGQVIIEVTYNEPYEPSVHWVELGIAERAESVVGAVYANVRIGSN